MNVFLPVKQLQTFLICFILMTISVSTRAADSPLLIKNLGEGHCLVRVNTSQKYLLLPVEDTSPDVRISMIVNNKEVKNFDVRLAIHKVDYFVPVDLSDFSGKTVSFKFKMNSNDPIRVNLSPDNTACCKEMKLSDTFDTTNREKFRPTYHFSPLYGWMNDPNGMVYKDGEYHLFYQYNPYGSKWGNMNWGHAISKDLVNWEHRPVAIAPDALGTIFSGSAVVDHNNTAGFGAGAIIAIYTQNSDRQVQSIAYSTDNGRTFTKYENNPVLVSEARDFRDPKVFWYEATKRWIMVLAVGQEMQIFSSPNLKDWAFESSFGEGYGAHGNVWECPDLFELPVEGTNEKKWVLLCSLGDGPFGDSATQYFIGSFDGKKFSCDNQPNVTKWMDWGKDHYATVTWSDAPDNRRIAIAWMSNWQYANDVPTSQYRSPNSIPRDLSQTEDGVYHMLIATRKNGKGHIAEFTSADLKEWESAGTFMTMMWDRFYECPDVFKMGDWWYLIYSEQASFMRKVQYFKGRTLEDLKATTANDAGIWPDNREGMLDSRAFYAGKTASDGTNRYIWGWCPTRAGNDNGNVGDVEPEWAGNLVAQRLIQHEDGTLTLGVPDAIDRKYTSAQEVKVMAKDGNVIESGKTYTLGEGASVIFNRLKVHNKISFTVKTASNTDRFGISFVRGTDSASWYSIHVNADEGKANFEKDGDDAKYLFDNKFNIPADNEYRVTIYSDQSVCVTYINDQLSFTNRIYQMQKNPWSLCCYKGEITVSDVQVSTY